MQIHGLSSRRKLGAYLIALFTPATLLAACQADVGKSPSLVIVAESKSTAEVGQVNIDIVSMDQWQDVKTRFDTKYGLTAPNAVNAVSQAATYENAATLQSQQFGLGLEADGSIVSNGNTTSNQTATTGGTTTSNSSAGSTTSSTRSTPTAAPNANPSTAGSIASTSFPATAVPKLAPETAYQAGDALFRSVAVRDGGFGRITPCGYVGVLVTFRVSIIPSKRAQPYDTFIDLSVLPGPKDLPPQSTSQAVQQVIPSTPSNKPSAGGSAAPAGAPSEQPSNLYKQLQSLFSTRLLGPSSGQVDAATAHDPLNCGYLINDDDLDILSFSSDSLENSQSDVLAQQTKAIILAAAVRAGMVAASANFQNLSEQLDHTLDLRPNSLLSVGRTGKNTLHIRLGANRYSAVEFETLPLEHDITIVLQVPYQFAYPKLQTGISTAFFSANATQLMQIGRPILAVGHYYFKDARSDPAIRKDPVQDFDADWQAKRYDDLANVATGIMQLHSADVVLPGAEKVKSALTTCATVSKDGTRDCAVLSEYAYSIPNSSLLNFETHLMPDAFDSSKPAAREDAEKLGSLALDLWQNLSEYSRRPGMTPRVSRRVPQSIQRCPNPDSLILVKDDGNNATASVTGAAGYAGERIFADLALWKEGAPKTRRTLSSAFDVTSSGIGDLQFGSFSNFFTKTDKVTGVLKLGTGENLVCSGTVAVPASTDGVLGYEVYYKRSDNAPKNGNSPKSKPTPGISAYPAQIEERDSNASMGITVTLADAKADSVEVTLSGTGELVNMALAATPSVAIMPKAGTVSLSSSGDYLVQIRNPAPKKSVVLNFQFKSGGKPTKTGKFSISLPVIKG